MNTTIAPLGPDLSRDTDRKMKRRGFLGRVGGGTVAALAAVELAGTDRAAAMPRSSRRGGQQPPLHVGAALHYERWGRFDGALTDDLEVMAQAGATSFRDDFHWADVEQEKGVLKVPQPHDAYVRRGAELGLRPLLILDYANPFYDDYDRPTSDEAIEAFARYAEFLARNFKGVVTHYEVWNEWDIGIGGGNIVEGGTPEDYLRVLRAVYSRLKAVDPHITVVSGGMTNAGIYNGFLDALLGGGVLDNCDVLGVHPYNYGDLPVEKRRPEAWWQAMNGLRERLHQHTSGEDFPVYCTEMGWPTQIDDRGVDQQTQAEYCARMYLLARTLPFIRGIWFYEFQDKGYNYLDNESNFGIVRPDLTPKQSYHTFAAVAGLVTSATSAELLESPDADIRAVRLAGGEVPELRRGDVIAVWSAHQDHDWSVVLRHESGRGDTVEVAELGRQSMRRRWRRSEWYDHPDAPVIEDEIQLTLRRTPMLLSGGPMGRVRVTEVVRREFPESER